MKVLTDEGKAIMVGGQALNADSITDKKLTEHIADTTIHVTAEEKETWDGKLSLTGGTITGNLIVDGTLSVASAIGLSNGTLHSDTDGMALYSTGYRTGLLIGRDIQFSYGGGAARVAGVDTPTADTDAANKKYVDDNAATALSTDTITATWNSVTV